MSTGVFLTGGTSFVPAVQNLFAERFGSDRLMSADQFESIAYGLALIGQARRRRRLERRRLTPFQSLSSFACLSRKRGTSMTTLVSIGPMAASFLPS